MNKLSILTLLLSLTLVLTGCYSVTFSELSSYQNLNPVADIVLSIDTICAEDKELKLLITNQSSEQLSYEAVYYIEQKRNDEWYSMDSEQNFKALGYTIESNSTNKLTITWESELPDGLYRVVKPMHINGDTNYFSVDFNMGE